MKLFFKIIFFLSISNISYARDIILISYAVENSTINTIKEIIRNDPKLPEALVTYKKLAFPCRPNKSTLLHLCVKGNNLIAIHQRPKVLKYSFNEFFND